MLRVGVMPPVLRFIAIDPGTDTLGLSVWDVDFQSQKAYIQTVGTHKANRSNSFDDSTADIYGERYARLNAHHTALIECFRTWQPTAIVSESPFMGRFPQAYAALVECIGMIQSAIREYDFTMRLITIDPMSAKQAVGVSKRGSNKGLVRDGVLALKDLIYLNNSPQLLDEHSIDSLAVGYTFFQNIRSLPWISNPSSRLPALPPFINSPGV